MRMILICNKGAQIGMAFARKAASPRDQTRQPAFAILEGRAGETMHDTQAPPHRTHRAGGREAKRAARLARAATTVPYITRKIGIYEVLDDEGLALIEKNADTILAEIGIDYRDDPEAL